MARRKPHAQTSALEWISAGFGLALLLLVFAVIGAEVVRGPAPPPAIRVEPRSIAAAGQGFVVEFDAVNVGGGTAAAVEIEGTLSAPGKPPETATATLDYVAGQARVAGGLFFTQDPRQGTLTLRALGYQEP